MLSLLERVRTIRQKAYRITRLIDLTQATLKEWALSQGIDADVSSMTQAQKVMLRYQYTMNRMSSVMGDFQDTSGRECAA